MSNLTEAIVSALIFFITSAIITWLSYIIFGLTLSTWFMYSIIGSLLWGAIEYGIRTYNERR